MSLVDVCSEIARVAALPGSGIAVAHNEPPEVLGTKFPVSYVDPMEGSFVLSIGESQRNDSVSLIVFVAPRDKNLPVEFARMAPIVDKVESTFRREYIQNGFSGNIRKLWVDRYVTGIRRFGSDFYHTVTFTIGVQEDLA